MVFDILLFKGNTKEEKKNKIIEDVKKRRKKKEVKNIIKATLKHSF